MTAIVPGKFKRLRGSRLRFARLREAVAESTAPAQVRGGAGRAGNGAVENDLDNAPSTCQSCDGTGIKDGGVCPTCEGSGLVKAAMQESVALRPGVVDAHVTRLREASAGSSPVYEVELLTEGKGNDKDRVFYTAQALREAVSEGVFNGMQAYADHPAKDEEANRPERSVRHLVGYYRNVRFMESGAEGKPAVKADLVVNQGQQWFVDLLESAIAAHKSDGVNLCGISIDGGGYVEPGTIAGERVNICRKITEAPSADVVTRAARGGRIVRRLRESVASAPKPSPQEAPMKVTDLKPKLDGLHTRLRESVATIRSADASNEDIAKAVEEVGKVEGEVAGLAGTEFEPEVKTEFREADGGGDAAKLEREKGELEVKLRESETARTAAETERDALKGETEKLNRGVLAAKVLRESKVPADSPEAPALFDELVRLPDEAAMTAHVAANEARTEAMFERFRESLGVGAPAGVEGAGALVPLGAPATAGGAEALAEQGIPILAESGS
jgi:hypothetical protein